MRQLYELAAADETLRFSPYCWRVKLALAHKNLAYETVPWHFTDKAAIAFSGQDKVPVLVDGGQVITDSQAIAEYLDEVYPHEPALFGDATAQALTLFIKNWVEIVLHPAIAHVILPDVHAHLSPADQAYFRESRERRFGRTLEDIAQNRPAAEAALHTALAPFHAVLRQQNFVSGAAPAYADHIMFGALQWACLCTRTALLEPHDPVRRWMHAVLATYGLETSVN